MHTTVQLSENSEFIWPYFSLCYREKGWCSDRRSPGVSSEFHEGVWGAGYSRYSNSRQVKGRGNEGITVESEVNYAYIF